MKKWWISLVGAVCVLMSMTFQPMEAMAQTHPRALPSSTVTTQSIDRPTDTTATEPFFIRGGSFHFSSHSSSRGFSGTYGKPNYGFGSSSRSGFGGFRYGSFSGFSHFGAGFLLGSMFHPFGGYWGYSGVPGDHPFSFLGIIFDLIILWLIWRFIRRFL